MSIPLLQLKLDSVFTSPRSGLPTGPCDVIFRTFRNRNSKKMGSRALGGLLCGSSLVVCALFALLGFPVVFRAIFQEMMKIVPGTPAHQAWKKATMPTKIR